MLLPAISLHDPWASLLVSGIKTIETRKGPVLSGFTGPLVICRTKADPVPYDLERFGVTASAKPYPGDDRGKAIGVVFVRHTFRLDDGHGRVWWHGVLRPLPEVWGEIQRAACYLDLAGRYLSLVYPAAWFPAPLPARGQQGRFSVEVPDSMLPEWARPAQVRLRRSDQ